MSVHTYVRPYVRMYVRPSTKRFFDFNVTRSKVKIKVTSPSKFEIRPFSKVISAAYNGSWQLTNHGFLN